MSCYYHVGWLIIYYYVFCFVSLSFLLKARHLICKQKKSFCFNDNKLFCMILGLQSIFKHCLCLVQKRKENAFTIIAINLMESIER